MCNGLTMPRETFLYRVDDQISYSFWVHQHVKVTCIQFIGGPACLSCMSRRSFIGFTKLNIETRGIGPAIEYRNGFGKEIQRARSKFGSQLLAQGLVWNDLS